MFDPCLMTHKQNKPRITKLPKDKATKRRRAKNKAARKSRRRNRRTK